MIRKNGQSLIEVIVAMAVAIIITSGLLVAVIVAVRNSQFAKNQVQATKFAQEGMENARQERDSDWDTFWAKGGTTYGPTVLGTGSVNFYRNTMYEDISGGANDKMKVTVNVSWTDTVGTHQSELVSYFTKPLKWK